MVEMPNLKRRDVLKKSGGAIAALSMVPASVEASSDDTTIIVTDEYKGDPLAKEEVPTEWYQQVKNARTHQDALSSQYSDESWLVSVTRKPSDDRIGDLNAFKLEIGVTSSQEAPNFLPEQIDGIPIEVVEEEPPTQECSTTCSCVKGGTTVDTEGPNGLHAHSGCATIEHPNYSDLCYLTCAHGMGDCGDNISSNEIRACKDSNSELIGYVDEWGWDLDWAFAEEATLASISGLDNGIISASYDVSGHVTENGIDQMIADSSTAEKFGMKTCNTSGVLDGVANWEYCSAGQEDWVKNTANSDGGDSGGVHFRERDSYNITTVIGVHHGSTSNHSWSGAAYRLNNKHSIEFTNSSSC